MTARISKESLTQRHAPRSHLMAVPDLHMTLPLSNPWSAAEHHASYLLTHLQANEVES